MASFSHFFLSGFCSTSRIDLLTLVGGQPNFSLGFPPVGFHRLSQMKVESVHELQVRQKKDFDLIKINLKQRPSVSTCVALCVLERGCSMAIIRRS